jgi:prepilin-type N-terminal cleavage/methylation domain-containing protein
MNKFLPRTTIKPQGFTLVELLVVVSIIAILAVVGMTILTGVQARARDARRQSDIQAIAKALEANRPAGANFYPVIAATWFGGGTPPTEPVGYAPQYTIVYNSTAGTAVTKPLIASWALTAANPTVSGVTATTVAAGVPSTCVPSTGANCIYNFQVCARLESGPDIFCVPSSQ